MTTNINNLSALQTKELIVQRASSNGFPEYCIAIDEDYQLEWFHEIIALKLEESVTRVESGEDVRLMIFMPPRHGKSDSATQKFPSWVLGKHPEWPFIVASYSQELATDFGQGTRDLMDSSNYKTIFDTRLRPDTQAKAKWMTEESGGYTAVGVGGAITGRGFKIGIVDDPFKNREEADSAVTRESVYKWWRSTFYTRQEGNTLIVLILTRWHDDDLAGRLLKEQKEAEKLGESNIDKWEVLEFKAIAEETDKFRNKGDALWPRKFNKEKLQRTKTSLGSYEWSALYQQNPIDEESQEFKKSWIKYRTWDEVQQMTTRKFATIDPSGSKRKTSDFTGVTRNYVNDQNEWNIQSTKHRISSTGVIKLIFELHNEGFESIGIESGIYFEAIEPFLLAAMEEKGTYPNVIPLKHGGIMKETRIRGLIPRYEYNRIFHIGTDCTDLENEYERFPKGAYDDCLDSLAYQGQIAGPPSAGIGDRVDAVTLIQNLTDNINDQSDTVVIGVYSSNPVRIVVANKKGIFYHETIEGNEPFDKINLLMKQWKRCFVIAYQAGDSIGIQSLKEKNQGKVFTAYFDEALSVQNSIKWGENDKLSDVQISRSVLIQLLVDEFRDKRLPIFGTKEDWESYIEEWTNLYRLWEETPTGTRKMYWESSAPQSFVIATILVRAGLSKFGRGDGKIFSGESTNFKTGVPILPNNTMQWHSKFIMPETDD